MYSPKISEDLIPIIYQLAKQHNKPMTKLVDDMIRKVLKTQIKDVQKQLNIKEVQNA